jgi:hypothetical protein
MQVWTMSLLCCALAAAAPAHAGWGDALKQQANKVIKKGEKKPAGDAGPVQESRIEPKLTPENVTKFKAAMELEVAERARVTKFLATVKPPEAYNTCKQEWVMSDAGQKVSQKYIEGMNGKSGAELQKHIETVGAEMQKGLDQHCGPDPGHYNQGWASQQIRDALGRASDQFAEDDYAYATWKEWVTEFCKYIEALKKQPDAAQKIAKLKDEGLRIPGTGAGIYYVYTASEANALLEQCDSLMPLIQATL